MADVFTIDDLNALAALTAADEVPVWDSEESGEPTKKITAQNMTASVKTLGSLVNTSEMNDAIQQSTADVIRTGDVVNSLTNTATDKPGSANMLKTLNDKITNIPNTLYSSYNILIDTVQISQTATNYTLYGSRKFSDYSILYITPMIGYYFRPGCVIPRSSFAGNGNGTSFNYTAGGIDVEVVIKYVSDTQVSMKYNASSARDVRIYLGALKLEYQE